MGFPKRSDVLKANLLYVEHARLKDHVNSMNGKLDAQIHEGGMSEFQFLLGPTIRY